MSYHHSILWLKPNALSNMFIDTIILQKDATILRFAALLLFLQSWTCHICTSRIIRNYIPTSEYVGSILRPWSPFMPLPGLCPAWHPSCCCQGSMGWSTLVNKKRCSCSVIPTKRLVWCKCPCASHFDFMFDHDNQEKLWPFFKKQNRTSPHRDDDWVFQQRSWCNSLRYGRSKFWKGYLKTGGKRILGYSVPELSCRFFAKMK